MKIKSTSAIGTSIQTMQLNLFALFVLLLISTTAKAQSGACTSGGYINGNSYVNYNATSAGDMTIDAAGVMEIAASGVYDIYGAVTNNGTITVDNSGVLNIYGDMANAGTIKVLAGGTINFYGKQWVNSAGTTVNGTGTIYFTAPRPTISASWQTAAPCIATYSGGNALQNLNGGGTGVDMDVALHINNSNNVVLTGTTSVAGSVVFDVNDGHVLLGNNDLVLTSTGTFSGYTALRYPVTNGTGAVSKEGIASGSSFFFPIGMAEADYTPATVTNNGASTTDYFAAVKDYANSTSIEGTTKDGMDRSWHIWATANTLTTLTLQHNSTTDGAQWTASSGFVTQWQGGNTIWQDGPPVDNSGSPNYNGVGTVAGSESHSRQFTVTTGSGASTSWFSKSSRPLAPLPLNLLEFNAVRAQNDALLSWVTAKDEKGTYVVEHSLDLKNWQNIGFVNYDQYVPDANGNLQYNLIHKHPGTGLHYYRLRVTDENGNSAPSSVRMVNFDGADDVTSQNTISVWPVPTHAGETITISGANMAGVNVFNSAGQLVQTVHPSASTPGVSLIQLSLNEPGVYMVSVFTTNGSRTTRKIIVD